MSVYYSLQYCNISYPVMMCIKSPNPFQYTGLTVMLLPLPVQVNYNTQTGFLIRHPESEQKLVPRITPEQTLVTEQQLLPLHPLPLGRTETQNGFQLRQDATRLLPLPPLSLPLLRRQHVGPRLPTFPVRLRVRHVGLQLLVGPNGETESKIS